MPGDACEWIHDFYVPIFLRPHILSSSLPHLIYPDLTLTIFLPPFSFFICQCSLHPRRLLISTTSSYGLQYAVSIYAHIRQSCRFGTGLLSLPFSIAFKVVENARLDIGSLYDREMGTPLRLCIILNTSCTSFSLVFDSSQQDLKLRSNL